MDTEFSTFLASVVAAVAICAFIFVSVRFGTFCLYLAYG